MIKRIVLIFFFLSLSLTSSLSLALEIKASVVKRPKIVEGELPELAAGKARLFIGGHLDLPIVSFSSTGQATQKSPKRTNFHIVEQQGEELIPLALLNSVVRNRLPKNRFYIDVDAGEKKLAYYSIGRAQSLLFSGLLSGDRPESIGKAKYVFEDGMNYYFMLGRGNGANNKRSAVLNLNEFKVDSEKMKFCHSLRLLGKREKPKSKKLKKMYKEVGIESWAEKYACQLSFQAQPLTISEKRLKKVKKFISTRYESLIRSIDYKIYQSYTEKKKAEGGK